MRFPLGRWRSALLAVAVVGALAMLAAACGEEKGPAAPGAAERIKGGELTVATLEGDKIDPHVSSFATEISVERMLWRGLYTLDINYEVQPLYAEALPEVSADGKTYTIKVEKGLKWSDGDDMMAEDFVMAFLRTCNPIHAGEYQYVLTSIVGCDAHFANEAGYDAALEGAIGVKALDDYTIEIKLQNPQPTFNIILTMWPAYAVPVHLFPKSSDPWPDRGPDAPGKLAYNGPYILTEYAPGDHATMVPNPNWGGEVKPTLDKLVLRFIEDLGVADRAYEAGEVDFAIVNLVELKALQATFEPTGEFLKVIMPTTVGMEMNLEKPPLDKLDVRLALVRADDHVAENETCQQGGYVPSTTWLPAATGGLAPDAFEAEIGFDLVKAKEHLTKAGYPNGKDSVPPFPVLTILVRDSPTQRCTAEFHKAEWLKNLNIDIGIEIVDSPTRSARFKAEDFDLLPGGWIQDYPDPENWMYGLFDTDGGNNHYNCSDTEIDDLVAKALVNTDNEERLAQWAKVNELVVTRVCGIGPFLHAANFYLIKPYVVGMHEFASGLDGVVAADQFPEAWGRSQ